MTNPTEPQGELKASSLLPASEMIDRELLEVALESHARAVMMPNSKIQHDRANECRNEILKRLYTRASVCGRREMGTQQEARAECLGDDVADFIANAPADIDYLLSLRAPVGEGEVAKAIADAEYGRSSHLQWAEHLESHGDSECAECAEKPYKLDAKREREWVAKYDRIIALLRRATPPPASGEVDAALKLTPCLACATGNHQGCIALAVATERCGCPCGME